MKYEKITADNFSLTENGLFYRLLVKVGLDATKPKYLAKRSLLIAGITWVPLAILSAIQGLLIGGAVDMPFLYDTATHMRFLVVIPMLIFAERSVDLRINEFIDQFFKAGIITESDRPLYMSIVAKCKRLSESLIADVVMLILIVANITLRWTAAQPEEATFWMQSPLGKDAGPSWAGTYFLFFAMPIVQFIFLRWIWRWTIWFIFFLRISKMPLKLRPAHADEAGGLGFLGTPPGPFLMVTLAMAILFASAIFEKVIFLGYKLPEYYVTMGAFVVLSIIINILPLFVFVKPLIKCRRQAVLEYGALVHIHHTQFDEKWIEPKEQESILGDPDASSAADINSVFQATKSMKTLPFDLKIMASTIIISAIPMLPLFALQFSIPQIIKGVLKLLV